MEAVAIGIGAFAGMIYLVYMAVFGPKDDIPPGYDY